MKLDAQIGDHIYQLELRVDNERTFAIVDGREYQLEASEVEPDVYLLKENGRVYQVSISPLGNNDAQEVCVRNHRFEVSINDQKRLRGSRSDHSHSGGQAEVKTAMPGKVVRVIATVGQFVEKGSSVVVVEAMKMQNEMKAPIDGVVKEIKVGEGSTVNAGDVLLVIE